MLITTISKFVTVVKFFGVFICTSLPSEIWMNEIYLRVQGMSHLLIFNKLLAVINGDGVNLEREKQFTQRITNFLDGLSDHFSHQDKAGFTLGYGNYGMLLFTAKNSVTLPVSHFFTLIDRCRTFFNAHSTRKIASTLVLSVTFTPFFLATQMLIQISTQFFILQNVLVDTFPQSMHSQCLIVNLLRAPILIDQVFNHFPIFRLNMQLGFIAATKCFMISLYGSVSSSARIAFQLPADGRFTFSNLPAYFKLGISRFQIGRNLVSLSFGNLCKVPNQCTFDQDLGADDTTSAYRSPAISVAQMSLTYIG